MSMKLRQNTQLEVFFPEASNKRVSPYEVSLYQKDGNHDVCTIRLLRGIAEPSDLITGSPVEIRWTQGSYKQSWQGYVTTFRLESSTDSTGYYEVTAVGASWALKESKPQAFKSKTRSQWAMKLAKDNGFKFIGDSHADRIPFASTSNKTYFEFLRDAADDIGYVFFVENTNLVFQSTEKTLRDFSVNVPVFQYHGQGIPVLEGGLGQTIESYELLQNDYDETGKSLRNVKSIAGVNPFTSKPFRQEVAPEKSGKGLRETVSDSVFDEHLTTQHAVTRSKAKVLSKGAASQARFHIPMEIRGLGDPRVRPHALIYVKGTGKTTDGFWYVKEVVHNISSSGQYRTKIVAMTDGLGAGTVLQGQQAVQKDSLTVNGVLNLEAALQTGSNFSNKPAELKRVKLSGGSRTYPQFSSLQYRKPQTAFTDKTVKRTSPSLRKNAAKWRTTKPQPSRTRS